MPGVTKALLQMEIKIHLFFSPLKGETVSYQVHLSCFPVNSFKTVLPLWSPMTGIL